MKKSITAALVGGIILWIWQFLSWAMINIHGPQNSYLENQDEILQILENKIPEGEYMIPTMKPGDADQESYMNTYLGKPWMQIKYHKELTNDMAINMVRGVIIDFVAIFLLCYLLIGNPNLTFQRTVISCIFVGLIGYFTISYTNSIWFKTNSIPDLIDAIVGWGLVGVWLGWFLNRNKK